jgi:hypothetical protein
VIRGVFSTVAVAALVAACSAAPAPTPQIVYVTPVPQPSVAQPTPIVVYVTPPPPPSGTVHAISGTFLLARGKETAGNWQTAPGGHCEGKGGYSDFRDGMTVVIKDQGGTVIATGAAIDSSPAPDGGCALQFSLPTVPDVPFYSVEIGHRGAVTYSRADMESFGWKLDLTLGT